MFCVKKNKEKRISYRGPSCDCSFPKMEISLILNLAHFTDSVCGISLPTQRIDAVNTLFHFTQKCKPCGKDHSLSSLIWHFILLFFATGLAALWWQGDMEGYYWHKVALECISGQSSKRSGRCGQGYDAMKAICLTLRRFGPLWNDFRAVRLCPRTPNMSFTFWRWHQIGQKPNPAANVGNLAGANGQIPMINMAWYCFFFFFQSAQVKMPVSYFRLRSRGLIWLTAISFV